jgi:putative FmdB family regulatory protein
MPLYEFECLSCRHEFEALVRGSDRPACPACGSQELQRLASAFGVKTLAATKSAVARARQDQKKANRDRDVAERERAEHHDD